MAHTPWDARCEWATYGCRQPARFAKMTDAANAAALAPSRDDLPRVAIMNTAAGWVVSGVVYVPDTAAGPLEVAVFLVEAGW